MAAKWTATKAGRRIRRRIGRAGLVGLLLAVVGCETPTVADPPLTHAPYQLVGPSRPKGGRILAMDISMAEDGDYEKAFTLAKRIGIQSVTLSFDWKDIEPQPGRFRDPDSNLAAANAYYPAKRTMVALDIRPIHTNRLAVPPDLEKTRFDDPSMARRFNAMMDFVLSRIPDVQLAVLYIGSEVDIYLGSDEAEWRQYDSFYQATRSHLKTRRPDLKVGVETTFAALTRNPTRAFLQNLNQRSDVIGVSYYHLNEKTGAVADPKEMHAVFGEITTAYPQKPIYFHQLGCPTSPALGSSEAAQREFIRETFKAWDAHLSQVKFIAFVWLTDRSPDALDSFKKYYGLSDKVFVEFLRTLGFRTYPGSGADKEAFRALQAEAAARGW